MPELSYLENSCSILGEGVIYNKIQHTLYWVDIKSKKIYTCNLDQHKISSVTFKKTISSLTFTQNNDIVATTDDGFEYIDMANGSTTSIINPEKEKPFNRFNDGKCDKYGRYFAGTMDNNEKVVNGSLYMLDKDNVIKKESELFISNGLGWNTQYSKFYLTDSPRGVIYEYDYNLENAALSNKKVFTLVDKKDGFPDGLTVDSENYIWSAHWDGGKITRYNPLGEIDTIIKLPVPRVTCCCFGGKNNSTLFITTAKYGLSKQQLEQAPLSGYTFTLETNVTGQEMNLFNTI